MGQTAYTPPYRITPAILTLVADLGEAVGRLGASTGQVSPQLRRGNRIRSVQASLAIEGNTLSLEQVTAILDGRKVLGAPREIQEVRNALAAYDQLDRWVVHSVDDVLTAHAILMAGLVDRPGRFRSTSVGIRRGETVVHVAPPASRVPLLIENLLSWLKQTEEHPLVASSVFHYEFEFIHPFEDGNGRMGRLWQTLALSRWHPVFAMLPVESVVRDRQQDYYDALKHSDQRADATSFVEFMLGAILQSTVELTSTTDQVADQVTDQVARLLKIVSATPMAAIDLMTELGLSHRPTFRENYLRPALSQGLIEMTRPETPTARNQKYRVTAKGKSTNFP